MDSLEEKLYAYTSNWLQHIHQMESHRLPK